MEQKEHLIKLREYLKKILANHQINIEKINNQNIIINRNIENILKIIEIFKKISTNLTITEEEYKLIVNHYNDDSFTNLEKNIRLIRKWGILQKESPQIIQATEKINQEIKKLEEKIKEIKNQKQSTTDINNKIIAIESILNSFNKKEITDLLSKENKDFLFELILSSDIDAIHAIDIIKEFTDYETIIIKNKIAQQQEKNKEHADVVRTETKAEEVAENFEEITKIETTEQTSLLSSLNKEDRETIEKLINEIHSYYPYYQLGKNITGTKIGDKTIPITTNPYYGQNIKNEKDFINYAVNAFFLENNSQNIETLKKCFYESIIYKTYETYLEMYNDVEKFNQNLTIYSPKEIINDLTDIKNTLEETKILLDNLEPPKKKQTIEETKETRIEELIPAKAKGLFLFLPDKDGNLIFDTNMMEIEKTDAELVQLALKQLRMIGPEIEFHNIGAIHPISANGDASERRNTNKTSVIKILSDNNINKSNHFRYRQSDIRIGFVELKPTGERKEQLEVELGREIGKVCLIIDVWHENAKGEGSYKEHNNLVANNINRINAIRELFNGSKALSPENLVLAKNYLKDDTIYDDVEKRLRILGV